jgi:thiaminase/transcriptional activator TenA
MDASKIPMPFERLKQTCHEDWTAYCQHEFVRRLGDGTLPAEAFRHYLQQDYKFLVHFARAWGLAVYKARDIGELRSALSSLKAIVDVEMGLHVKYCESWGISEADLHRLSEAKPTMAYTRYVLDTGNRGDLLDLHVALAPCLVGYAEIASWLTRQDFGDQSGNPYQPWIEMYASDEFQQATANELTWLNGKLAEVSPARFAQLAEIFRDATRLEVDFWQMGLDHAEA